MERIEAALQKAREQRLSGPLSSQVISSASRFGSEASWASLPVLSVDLKLIARNRIVTFSRSDSAHASFDMLRTRLLQKMRENRWTTVAITSPTAGCGKSVVSLNLAFSLANQKECRTALVDLDLRRPQVANLLGLKNAPSMEKFLKGQGELEGHLVRYGDNVAIAANSRPVRFSSELLQSQSTAAVLKELKRKLDPHVIIFDLPPMLSSDDVMAFVPNVDCAILVVAAESTTLREADVCERDLAEKTNVVGVVLNKCRFTPDKYGY
jgi:protein-tyrosine kinase